MKKRKILVGLLAASAMLTTVAACKDKDDEPVVDNKEEVTQYTVTFDSQGGSNVDPTKTTDLGLVGKPKNPTLAGKFFVEWCTDKEGTTPFDFGSKVTADITLYAKWRDPIDLAVDFYDNVKEEVYATTAAKEGGVVTYPETNPDGGDPLYSEFTGWYTEADPTKQSSKNKWDEGTPIYEGLKLYAGYKKKEAGVTITCGADQIASLGAADGTYNFAYKNFDFGVVKGKQAKNGVDCIKDGNDATITVTETSKLTIKVGSGSSNTEKQYVALFKVTATDESGNMTEGTLMNPTNAEAEGLTVRNGKVTIVSANDGFSTIEFDKLEAGTYVLTAGGSNALLNDANGGGTNLIAEISLAMTKELSPVDYIAKSNACPNYHVLAGRTADLSTLKIIAEYKNGSSVELDYNQLTIDEEDLAAVDYTKAGTYNVGVTYVNEYDEEVYELEGGIDINVYEIAELEVAPYKMVSEKIAGNTERVTKLLPKVFVDGKITTENLVVIATARCDEMNKDFVLADGEFDITIPEEVAAGLNKVKISTGSAEDENLVETSYDVYSVENVFKNNDGMVNVLVAQSMDVTVTDSQVVFNTINDALRYLEICDLDEDVVKVIQVAPGVYHEKVEVSIPNVVLVGSNGDATVEEECNTIITYDALNGVMDPSGKMEHSTDGAATISIRATATGFTAANITLANDYNTHKEYLDSKTITNNTQATAVLVQADQAMFGNVRFSSYHDTLYAQMGRQYYEDCYIEGRTDYIFGYNATAYFQNCTIHTIAAFSTDADGVTVSDNNGGYVVATKGNRSGNGVDDIEYGYVFNECIFEADAGIREGSVSLGRGWAEDMKMMIMNSEISGAFSKAEYTGQLNYGTRYTKMNAVPNAAQLFEYNNTGDGAITESINNTCTVLADTVEGETTTPNEIAAKYTLVNIFGAVNKNVSWDVAWAGPLAKDANLTVTVVGYGDNFDEEYPEIGWVGSTFTQAQLEAEAAKLLPEYHIIVGFYSDAECTKAYDVTTVLEEENHIYLKIKKAAVVETATYDAMAETPAEGWVEEYNGTTTLGETAYKCIKDENCSVTSAALPYANPYVIVNMEAGSTGSSKGVKFVINGLDAEGNVVATTEAYTAPGKVMGECWTGENGTGSKDIELKVTEDGKLISKVQVVMLSGGKGFGVKSVNVSYETPFYKRGYALDLSAINPVLANPETDVYDKQKLNNTELNNPFLTIIKEDDKVTSRYDDSKGGFYAIENKDDNLKLTFAGKGTITITFTSTGGSNVSRVGLKNATTGAFLEASDIVTEGTVVRVTEADTTNSKGDAAEINEIGAYQIGDGTSTGGKEVTLTFTVAEAGDYYISCPSTWATRGARILAIDMIEILPF